jgi:hypothetical protein
LTPETIPDRECRLYCYVERVGREVSKDKMDERVATVSFESAPLDRGPHLLVPVPAVVSRASQSSRPAASAPRGGNGLFMRAGRSPCCLAGSAASSASVHAFPEYFSHSTLSAVSMLRI